MTGGEGVDRFTIDRNSSQNVITDFDSNPETADVVYLPFWIREDSINYSEVGGDLLIDIGGGTAILLEGVKYEEFDDRYMLETW